MTDQRIFNVLFLCTGNSARSIMAEAIMNREGGGRFRAFSAGSHPKGQVHPVAIKLLGLLNHDVSSLRSKSWDEFAGAGVPPMDFIFTVCDNAASEICPVWPGNPVSANWGVPDPAEATGNDAEIHVAFEDSYRMLRNRISLFVALPTSALVSSSIKAKVDEMGRNEHA